MTRDIHTIMDSLDGVGLAAKVRQKEITPTELVEAVIERLEAVNPKLNALAEPLYEQALNAAKLEIDTQQPFCGVPTLIKDLFSPLKGARMASGSFALGEARAEIDAEAVARLRRAGCLFVGTSTSPEFGTSYTTESSRFGATRNPWDLERSVGGSSGGAAALVAARVVPFAHGNDGGGSLRVPASCCGIFGLKPTRGRMPSGPMVGEGWGGMGTPHAMTMSVRDSAALLDATSGADLGAPYAAPEQRSSFLSAVGRSPGTLRIALAESMAPWESGTEAREAVQLTVKLCESLGHRVESVSLPVNLPEFIHNTFSIIAPNTQNFINTLGEMRGAPVKDSELEPRTRVMLREKGRIDATTYVAAIEYMHALGRSLAGFMCDYDLILTPTLTRKPPLIGELDAFNDTLCLEDIIHQFHSYSPFTAIFNATGQPAMSVPLYWTSDTLPIGSHFAARFGDESTLLSLAAQLERSCPWADKTPQVNAMAR